MTARERLFARAREIKAAIEQIFMDCDYWNDAVRGPSESPLDADPDGQLAIALAYVNGILNGEVYVAPDRTAPPQEGTV